MTYHFYNYLKLIQTVNNNYHHINSVYNENGEEYVREYEHKNGLCSLNYTKVFGAWQNCF